MTNRIYTLQPSYPTSDTEASAPEQTTDEPVFGELKLPNGMRLLLRNTSADGGLCGVEIGYTDRNREMEMKRRDRWIFFLAVLCVMLTGIISSTVRMMIGWTFW